LEKGGEGRAASLHPTLYKLITDDHWFVKTNFIVIYNNDLVIFLGLPWAISSI
jgi:hypothetical protein